ncbi:MAG: DUF4390 domain-containing protein [Acidobacteriota bacterium]
MGLQRGVALLLVGAWAFLWPVGAVPQSLTGGKARTPAPRIEILSLTRDAGGVSISFRLLHAFDKRIRDKLDSGLRVTFRHRVEVGRHRTFWFDRVAAQKKIMTSAILDRLTRQYSLRRVINGGLVESLTTTDPDEMTTFMTRIDGIQLPLPAGLDRQRMEVGVRSMLETRFFLFFPYDYDTGWAQQPLPPLPGENDHAP